MRVADKMAFNQINSAIAKNRTDLSNLQSQAATQKRVTKPSDDPVAAGRVLGNRIEQRSNEQYIKNLNYAKGFIEFSEQSLGELTEVIVRAKELAIGQSSDASASQQSRRVVAEEVKQLYNQIVQIANRKLGERFVFGGFKTTENPYDDKGSYKGDDGELKVHINKETFLPMNMPGSIAFNGKGLSRDGFNFKSEPQPKNVGQLAQMQKREEEMKVSGEDHGQAQAQDIESRGPASTRITEEVAEINAQDGGSSAQINTDIKQQNGEDLFRVMKGLQVSLETNDKMGIQESLDRLDDAMQQVVIARAALGSRVSTIENTLNSMNTAVVDNKTSISNLEDADVFEVISDINKTEGALQATLQTSGKLIQKSLMDFIS